MAKIEYKEGAEFPELPTKTPILCKVIESEFLEDEENPWYGKETGKFDKNGDPIIDNKEFRNLVKVIFQSVEEETAGSRIWFNATASINEKSKLRPLLEAAAFDHDPDKKELEAYDTDDLVGQYVYVLGSFGPKDKDRKFLRPESFARYLPQFKAGFTRPGVAAKSAPVDDDDDDDDETKALKAALAAAKAKKAAAKSEPKAETKAEKLRRELAELEAAEELDAERGEPETKPARKQSTRDKAVAKTKAKVEVEDPEAAF